MLQCTRQNWTENGELAQGPLDGGGSGRRRCGYRYLHLRDTACETLRYCLELVLFAAQLQHGPQSIHTGFSRNYQSNIIGSILLFQLYCSRCLFLFRQQIGR